MRHLPGIIGFIVGVLIVIDNWRLRRRLHVDEIAREAEEALGPPRIGDIVMPDPSDPRWEQKQEGFSNGARMCFALGPILIPVDTLQVFIGNGRALTGGEAYGKRVDIAYKRRLVEKVRGQP